MALVRLVQPLPGRQSIQPGCSGRLAWPIALATGLLWLTPGALRPRLATPGRAVGSGWASPTRCLRAPLCGRVVVEVRQPQPRVRQRRPPAQRREAEAELEKSGCLKSVFCHTQS